MPPQNGADFLNVPIGNLDQIDQMLKWHANGANPAMPASSAAR